MSMTGSSMEGDGVSKLSGNSSSMTDSLASNSTTTIKGRLKQVQEKCRKSSMTTKLKTKLAGKRKTELSMSASSSATNKQAADSTSSSSASSVRSYSHDALNLLDRGQAILVIHFFNNTLLYLTFLLRFRIYSVTKSVTNFLTLSR